MQGSHWLDNVVNILYKIIAVLFDETSLVDELISEGIPHISCLILGSIFSFSYGVCHKSWDQQQNNHTVQEKGLKNGRKRTKNLDAWTQHQEGRSRCRSEHDYGSRLSQTKTKSNWMPSQLQWTDRPHDPSQVISVQRSIVLWTTEREEKMFEKRSADATCLVTYASWSITSMVFVCVKRGILTPYEKFDVRSEKKTAEQIRFKNAVSHQR